LALVAVAASLPALVTCVVLGIQLNEKARSVFANGLQANLETFALVMRDVERNLVEGVRRTAADNTLQVTLELEIRPQLAAYMETQRKILNVDFLAAYNKEGHLSAVARAPQSEMPSPAEKKAEVPCTFSDYAERQVLNCDSRVYVVSFSPILRRQEGLGDAAGAAASRLGFLVGGVLAAEPTMIASLKERKIGEFFISVDGRVIYTSLPLAPSIGADEAVQEYVVGNTGYLGAAKPLQIGARTLVLGLLTPLAPLRRALLESVAVVIVVAAFVIAAALLVLRLVADRLLRPVRELGEGAKRVGDGDLAHRISVRSGDELEILAAQFNDMSAKLQKSYADLEENIEDRARLRRFLAPQVAELLMSSGERDAGLESRRCEVSVVFCDLRGFTAFAESAEPEEVMGVLREYHSALGEEIFRFEGTLERFVGDGLLVVFNDPIPCADHAARAVQMAIAMRERMSRLSMDWRRFGHELGFGIGIAQGFATVGPIGFDRRLDYAVIGSVPNMASRLCDAAKPGQILVSQRVFTSVEGNVDAKRQQDLTLKGFQRPVPAYEIVKWREHQLKQEASTS
jgi:class 3 adenylate cyclase